MAKLNEQPKNEGCHQIQGIDCELIFGQYQTQQHENFRISELIFSTF